MVRRLPAFTPLWLMVRAALIVVVYLVVHWAGWRDYARFLSGTTTVSGEFNIPYAVVGVFYIACHFAFVLLAPVLLLTAGMQWALIALATRLKSFPGNSRGGPVG
jgi:hypothetical protein